MYAIHIIRKGTYSCINDAVTSYYGTITNNCSKIFNYLIINNKSCEHSFGVAKESYNINNTNGYCIVKDNDFYEIKKILSFEDLPVEVIYETQNTLMTMLNTLLRLSLITLLIGTIFYCFIYTAKTQYIQRTNESFYIVEIPDPPPIVNRNDYSLIEDIPSDQECSICMEPFNEDTVKLSCEHMYHKECIIEWFQNSKRCPLCNNEG